MADMTPQQALDVLRQVRGLRDAFLGFNQVVDGLTPMINMLADVNATVASMDKTKAALADDIKSLDAQRADVVKELERAQARLASVKSIITSMETAIR